MEASGHRLPTTVHSHEGAIGSALWRIYIFKATQMGTKVTDRPKCHGHLGWKITRKGYRE